MLEPARSSAATGRVACWNRRPSVLLSVASWEHKLRTACKYGGKNIAFHVNEGSTSFWLSLLVEFEDGEGDIGSMQLKQANSAKWLDMKHVWGATWCLYGGPTAGPFSVRLTTLSAPKTLTARDVIPRNWAPKGTYSSRLNFEVSL